MYNFSILPPLKKNNLASGHYCLDGKSLACLGDEPYNEQNRAYAEGVDWLLCEKSILFICGP